MGRTDVLNGPGEPCYDTEDGIHIPGCMGCAVAGHDSCTCHYDKPNPLSPSERISRLEEIVERLQAQVEALEAKAKRRPKSC